MSWAGYFEYDGNELINSHRTEAYARRLSWFRPNYKNTSLGPMLGHKAYRTPGLDYAPWLDPDFTESYDFYGVYPLAVTGMESSTRTATITESTGDGGIPGRIRHATKQMVFNTLLLAGSEASAEYGMRWLRRVLLGGVCGATLAQNCFGASLCYLSSEPFARINRLPLGSEYAGLFGGTADFQTDDPILSGGDADDAGGLVFEGGDAGQTGSILTRSYSIFQVSTRMDDVTDCLTPYQRSLRNVSVTTGPTLLTKLKVPNGAAWQVSFTAVAGSPFELGPEREVVTGFLSGDVPNPWPGGVEPAGASMDTTGFIFSEETGCDPVEPAPLIDPAFPSVIIPPGIPSVPIGNFTPPVNWRRRQFTIPKQYIPLWGEMVPLVKIHARNGDTRNLRIRFYSDPYGEGDASDDPCAFCGDIVVSYVPLGYTMVLDGAEEVVYAIGPGGVEYRADSLVFASNGTPFTWPALSCGFGYIVTLDLPETSFAPVVDLSLHERTV